MWQAARRHRLLLRCSCWQCGTGWAARSTCARAGSLRAHTAAPSPLVVATPCHQRCVGPDRMHARPEDLASCWHHAARPRGFQTSWQQLDIDSTTLPDSGLPPYNTELPHRHRHGRPESWPAQKEYDRMPVMLLTLSLRYAPVSRPGLGPSPWRSPLATPTELNRPGARQHPAPSSCRCHALFTAWRGPWDWAPGAAPPRTAPHPSPPRSSLCA